MSAASIRISTCGISVDDDTCAARGEGWADGDLVDYFPRSLYGIGVWLIWLRLLQFMTGVIQTVGVLWIILGKMGSDVYYFLVILVIFSCGFGVTMAVLLRGSMVNASTEKTWGVLSMESPFWSPFWGYLGPDYPNTHETYSNLQFHDLYRTLHYPPLPLFLFLFANKLLS